MDSIAKTIGADKTGIRISPYGTFNNTGEFAGVEDQFLELVAHASKLGLLYLHVLDHSAMGAPAVPHDYKLKLRNAFDGPFILAGGFDKDSAEQVLTAKEADLIGFGRPFISNPDLVKRMQSGLTLTQPDMSTFYTGDAKGYTDYPFAA